MLSCPSVLGVFLIVCLDVCLLMPSEREMYPAKSDMDGLALLPVRQFFQQVSELTRSMAVLIDHSSSIGVVDSGGCAVDKDAWWIRGTSDVVKADTVLSVVSLCRRLQGIVKLNGRCSRTSHVPHTMPKASLVILGSSDSYGFVDRLYTQLLVFPAGSTHGSC